MVMLEPDLTVGLRAVDVGTCVAALSMAYAAVDAVSAFVTLHKAE